MCTSRSLPSLSQRLGTRLSTKLTDFGGCQFPNGHIEIPTLTILKVTDNIVNTVKLTKWKRTSSSTILQMTSDSCRRQKVKVQSATRSRRIFNAKQVSFRLLRRSSIGSPDKTQIGMTRKLYFKIILYF